MDSPFQPVNSKISFPQIEEEILKFWEENDCFRKSLELRKNAEPFIFYDGPPFATGLPHYGHILSGTLKDVIPRYQTMLGKYVPRRFGWDCHGLPVEHEIEKTLGFKNREDIEKYGVKNFNEACRSIVLKYTAEWEKTVGRMGRWVDFRNSYKTMDLNYTEGIFWAFSELWKKGLIYEGKKVVAYSPKLGSTLSNFEANLNYKDIDDPAVTVKFELAEEPGTFVLAWTTTPWTLPSNTAIGFGRDLDYVLVEHENVRYWIAEECAQKYFGESPKIVDRKKGKDFREMKYNPLFSYFSDTSEKRFVIIHDEGDYVTTSAGTGIVHFAPMYGTEDAEICNKWGIYGVDPIDKNGYFDETIPELKGLYFRKDDVVEDSIKDNANKRVIQKLEDEGKLFQLEWIRHSYPFCWRTDCALMYRGVETIFVNVRKIKELLIKNNQEIHWIPDHIRDGRFGKMLENAPDWAISRSRFWGAPIPLWKCEECSAQEVVGSIKEMGARAKKKGKIYVVRHGEGEHNVADTISSKIDDTVNLTKKGEQQAKRTGEALKEKKVDVLYCSPLLRTRQTAEIIVQSAKMNIEITIDDRIKENDAGKMDKKTIPEWQAQFTKNGRFHENPHNGESQKDVEQRVLEFLREIQKKHGEKNILIVSHGTVMRTIERYFHNLSETEVFDCKPKTGEMYEYSFSQLPQDDFGKMDLHRPYIDEIEFDCSKCGGIMKRIPDVFDCWFESGSMPYASRWEEVKNQLTVDRFQVTDGRRQFTEDSLQIRPLESEEDWKEYHHILKTELFEKHYPDITYRSDYLDIYKKENHPHLVIWSGEIIGAFRLDEMADNTFGMRTFAIKKEFQKKGFGTKVLRLLENFACEKKCEKIVVNAHPTAISFYKAQGYQEGVWKGDSTTGSIPLGKIIFLVQYAQTLEERKKCHEFFQKMWKEEFNIDVSHSRKNFFEDPEIFFVEKEEKIVGCTQIAIEENMWKIGRIGVLPEYRKKGIGELLMKKVCDEVQKKGEVKIWTDAESKAVPFYESCGFRKTGELRAGTSNPNLKCIRMEKNLSTCHLPLATGSQTADFIAEGLDQTRGWFYTLHVLGNALFQKPAFTNVIVNGIVLAEDGQKMSKSKKNYPDPQIIFDNYGADAMRFYLMNSPVVRADDLKFCEDGVAEVMRKVFLPFWNAYYFFVTYANIDKWAVDSGQLTETPGNKLDQWILAELGHLVQNFRKKLDSYEIDAACREIPDFLDKLTNFYIRRSRRRFWKSEVDSDKNEAFQTLYRILKTFSQILAPISPFLPEKLWQNLRQKNDPISIHHTDFPSTNAFPKNELLRAEISAIRTIISLALAIRAKKKIRVRQPLAVLKIALPVSVSQKMIRDNTEIILEEINVKELQIVKNPDDLAEISAKPDARKLGPKFGKEVQNIIREAKLGNFVKNDDETVLVAKTWKLEPDEIEIGFAAKEGLDTESDAGIVVALDTEMTEELKMEGFAREIIRHLQELRKKADYGISDRISAAIFGADEIVKKYGKTIIAKEVLATDIFEKLENPDAEVEVEIEGKKVCLSVKK